MTAKKGKAAEMVRIGASVGRARRILALARSRALAGAGGRGSSETRRKFEMAASAAALAAEACYHALILAQNLAVEMRQDEDLLGNPING
jgi:hypothetical protein